MKVYRGYILDNVGEQVVVLEEGQVPRKLPPGYEHGVNHSPDGFSWGYRGSGPAQLAFAILLEEFGLEVARRDYQRFKEHCIARIAQGRRFRLRFDPQAPRPPSELCWQSYSLTTG